MSARPLVVGIDASTTACKAIAFDGTGTPVAEGRCAIRLYNPAPDAWEQDAEEWWSALETAVRELVAALGSEAANIRALAIANQRETFVLTDVSGKPLHPALVWMDSRCRPEVIAATEALGSDFLHSVTGKPPCVTPSFYKALFLLGRGAPALRTRQLRLLDVHAFLAWRLTGEFATSIAAADPTGLVDLRRGVWSEDLLAHLGLEIDNVPRLTEPGQVLGRVLTDIGKRLGLPPNLPVAAGAGDGQAAGLGAGITGAGRAYLNLGTAIVSGVLSREYLLDRAFRTMKGGLPGSYFLETDLKGGTFTVSWFLEKFVRPRDLQAPADALLRELDDAASLLRPGSNGLMLVPYWNGVMNPYWDDDATGVVIGARGDHGPAHFHRAILEGIAFEQRLHSRAVEAATGIAIDELVVMGGGANSDLFCGIVADVLNRPVVRSYTAEATALGAAMLAAPAGGLFPDVESAARAMGARPALSTEGATRFAPGVAREAYDTLFEDVYVRLYPAVRTQMARLRALTS